MTSRQFPIGGALVDIFTPEKRSKIMSSIHGKDTSIELILRKALWKEGIRGYRVL